ncbi:hypothetical protein PanWU01x14_342890 [Parasponia andersonii]|uniref:Uncharacterized protein n=1 Tax=Parasponia andersonii TaxID=3476 RepID=A0A2P5ADL5_PARAD|nr:hypothetical protein PanWU01x14_342890 [Parasponia andersonii]
MTRSDGAALLRELGGVAMMRALQYSRLNERDDGLRQVVASREGGVAPQKSLDGVLLRERAAFLDIAERCWAVGKTGVARGLSRDCWAVVND